MLKQRLKLSVCVCVCVCVCVWSHLLGGDIEGDGAHIHIDKAVRARQDEEKTCMKHT